MTPLLARLAPFAISLLAGLAQALSIAAPWNGQPLWWLQLAALAVLAWQVRRAVSWRRAVGLGWVFATAWLTGTFWWLFISLHTYGGLAAPLAALAVVGLAAFLGSYYAAAAGLVRWLAAAQPPWTPAVFAGAWLAAELMREVWFTGFPWGSIGYAHIDGPLAALAPWVGAFGMAFVAALLAAWLGALRWRTAVAALAVLAGAALLAHGNGWSQGAGSLRVSLLQGNIPQDEKFEQGTGVATALAWYGEQLVQGKSSLLVAPETAVPLLPDQLPEGYYAGLKARFGNGAQAALLGIPLGSFEAGYTNSVVGFKPGASAAYRYDKGHLVPFGEFIPTLFKWFTQMMNIPLGDFNRGAVGQPTFDWAGQRIAPNICYEDLFGEEIGAQFADPAKAPTILANVSNIGWFGDSLAIDQHLQISRLRSLEFERPMIRATNTGATVIIDHRGHVVQALARHTRGVLTGQVEGRNGITPYAWWVSRLGLWPVWLLALLAVGLAVPGRKQTVAWPGSVRGGE